MQNIAYAAADSTIDEDHMEIMKVIRDISADAQSLYQVNKQLVSSYLKRRYVFYNNQFLNKRMTGASGFRFKKETMLFVISFEYGDFFFDALKEKLEIKGFSISYPYKTKFSTEFQCGYRFLEISRGTDRENGSKQVLAKVIPGFSLQSSFIEGFLVDFDRYVFFDENDFPCLSPNGHMHMDYLKYADTIHQMEWMYSFFKSTKIEADRKVKILDLLRVYRDYSVLVQRSSLFVREICSGDGFDWFLSAAGEFQNKRSSLGIYLASCVDHYLPDVPWSLYGICETIPYEGNIKRRLQGSSKVRKTKEGKNREGKSFSTVQQKTVSLNTNSARHLLELSVINESGCSGVLSKSQPALHFKESSCAEEKASNSIIPLDVHLLEPLKGVTSELDASKIIDGYKESFKESPLPQSMDEIDRLSSELEEIDVTGGSQTIDEEYESNRNYSAPPPSVPPPPEGYQKKTTSPPHQKHEGKRKIPNVARLRNEQQEGMKKSFGNLDHIKVTQLRGLDKKDPCKNAKKLAAFKKREMQFLLLLATISIGFGVQYSDSLPVIANDILHFLLDCTKDTVELAAYILPGISTFLSLMYISFAKKSKKKDVAKVVLALSLPCLTVQSSWLTFNYFKERREKRKADEARAIFPRYFASYDDYEGWGYGDEEKAFVYKKNGRIDIRNVVDSRLASWLSVFEFDLEHMVKEHGLKSIEQQQVFREKCLQLVPYCGLFDDYEIDFGCIMQIFYRLYLNEGASLSAFVKIDAKEQNIGYDHCFYVRVNKIINFTDSSGEGGRSIRYLEFQPCHLKNNKRVCDRTCQKADSCRRTNVDVVIPDGFLQESYRLHRYSKGRWKPSGDTDYYDLKPQATITMKNIPESGYYAFYNVKSSVDFPPLFFWANKGEVEVLCTPQVLK